MDTFSYTVIMQMIPEGYYGTAEQLVTALNDAKLGFKFDITDQGRTTISPVENFQHEAMIKLPPLLHAKLGFDTAQDPIITMFEEQPVISARFADPNWEDELMFLYLDIIEPQIFCSTKTPLLAIIPFEPLGYGETVSHYPNPLHYFSIDKSQFSDITVQILTSYGKPVSFQSGLVYLRLHVRPRKYG